MEQTIFVDWHVALIGAIQQGFAQLAATLTTEGERMSAAMDALVAQVARATTAMDSATVVLEGILARLIDAGTDQAKLDELRVDLEDNITRLSAATAAVPPPAPTP